MTLNSLLALTSTSTSTDGTLHLEADAVRRLSLCLRLCIQVVYIVYSTMSSLPPSFYSGYCLFQDARTRLVLVPIRHHSCRRHDVPNVRQTPRIPCRNVKMPPSPQHRHRCSSLSSAPGKAIPSSQSSQAHCHSLSVSQHHSPSLFPSYYPSHPPSTPSE